MEKRPNRSKQQSNRSRNRYRHRRGGKPSVREKGINFLFKKYLNLLDQHLVARKKYFEKYGLLGDTQVARLEKNFYDSLGQLRDFESNLSPEDKSLLNQRINGQKNDTTYSMNRNLAVDDSPEHKGPVSDSSNKDDKFESPHLLCSQKSNSFKEDTEESEGTMEDYHNYKGTPPKPI